MAAVIDLEPVPAQSVSWVDGPIRYELRVFSLGNSMAVDLTIGGVRILSGFRVVAETPVIPYRYLETGNLMFVTEGALPSWSNFGRTQFLVFIPGVEVGND